MKLKKKGDQTVGASVLLTKRKKIPTGLNMKIKYRAETGGKVIQRMSQPGVHHRHSHQTPTLLWMLRIACWKDPDIAVY